MMGCDVSDPEQVQGMIEKVLTDFGPVDVLINNAGIGMRKPFCRDNSYRPLRRSCASITSAPSTAPMGCCRR